MSKKSRRKKLLKRIMITSLALSMCCIGYNKEESVDDGKKSTDTLVIHAQAKENITVADYPEPPTESSRPIITDADVDLLALVTMAEAEGESEYGQRLVIDTILNRVDHEKFPDTIEGVIYQESQFSSMWNGRVDRCYVKDDIRQLVIEELDSRTNYDVIFFTAGEYGKYGNPLFVEGNHYFASY